MRRKEEWKSQTGYDLFDSESFPEGLFHLLHKFRWNRSQYSSYGRLMNDCNFFCFDNRCFLKPCLKAGFSSPILIQESRRFSGILEKIPRMIISSPFIDRTRAGLTFEDWRSVKGKLTKTVSPGSSFVIDSFTRVFPLGKSILGGFGKSHGI